jgi:hypothetical protein
MVKRECAFCDSTASKTGEHVWSKWISRLLPGKKKLRQLDTERKPIRQRISNTIDWKAPVVCHNCNTRWMSHIVENKHAKPAMTDLILDKSSVPITRERAHSIALFAFKTAVVLDQLVTSREPFFERAARHNFRESLTIPHDVGMWLTRMPTGTGGEASSLYHEGSTPEGGRIEVYACTFSVAHLVLQVAAFRVHKIRSIEPYNYFPAVPFWPEVASGVVWPVPTFLVTIKDFNAFTDRWLDVNVTQGSPSLPDKGLASHPHPNV